LVVFPFVPSTVLLCRILKLTSGDPITAEEAFSYGMVNKVVEPADLEKATLQLAEKIITAPASVLALGKKAFYEQIALKTPDAYAVAGKGKVVAKIA
jgi:enoyl-CoA hydratase/carnithine racemase